MTKRSVLLLTIAYVVGLAVLDYHYRAQLAVAERLSSNAAAVIVSWFCRR